MQANIPEEDLGVLHNIELALMQVYRAHPDMTDWEAREAVNALLRVYQAQLQNRPAPKLKLTALTQEAFESVQIMCEVQLGHATVLTESGDPADAPFHAIRLDELVGFLKRVRSSIETWNKELGRRGYFDFVNPYV